MNQDLKYLLRGGLWGMGIRTTTTGLTIAALGRAFLPDEILRERIANEGQIFRYARRIMPKSAGITLGKNISVRLTDDVDYNRYLLQHEVGHRVQIREMGGIIFYTRILGEYIKHLFSDGGFYSVYNTEGTLEYLADKYSFERLGYYYKNNTIKFQFP
ncbi:MAG: hypothetical protein SPF56_05950 [Bacteroidaceae bacterium]|nr:hypothetical protein [Prevotellaceae bacterium]MDY5632020.1 hypothetical protein [Bacteroidaceae bacterium]